ncbi:hypothetical protein HPB49_021898 [Dermacentor silvarum]|uniref:Uncharacterized protein n=1 Tax=Dermacentor silvarum TaxID=543639 RepID=A0ACB8CHK6_DERSI|nr:hypothetical protein HPB49_021898 [Dermacentor silvarum]
MFLNASSRASASQPSCSKFLQKGWKLSIARSSRQHTSKESTSFSSPRRVVKPTSSSIVRVDKRIKRVFSQVIINLLLKTKKAEQADNQLFLTAEKSAAHDLTAPHALMLRSSSSSRWRGAGGGGEGSNMMLIIGGIILLIVLGAAGVFVVLSGKSSGGESTTVSSVKPVAGYQGVKIGPIVHKSNNVTGNVYAADDKTFHITQFSYDGLAPDAHFAVSKEADLKTPVKLHDEKDT